MPNALHAARKRKLLGLKKRWKDILDERVDFYNQQSFIETDPIQIPHRFSKTQDIEIAAFLVATIAWGNRKSILQNGEKLLQIMDYAPHQFVTQSRPQEIRQISGFVHRTFNAQDLQDFLLSLQKIYTRYASMQELLIPNQHEKDMSHALERLRSTFLQDRNARCSKHFSSPYKNSAAKRLNMFLRWMVRQDQQKVDFGIWNQISPAQLSIPLDVHSGKVARELGLLQRKQNDWKAVRELDEVLRFLDPEDPVKYDFALFGMSAIG